MTPAGGKIEMIGKILGLGAALGAYALWEPYRFRLRHHLLPAGPGAPSLLILHISDAHLTARDGARARFLRSLPERLEQPVDLVVMTGDMLEDDSGIEPALWSLEGLTATLGRFYVLGSHDYYQARFKPPSRYFTGNRGPQEAPRADVERFEAGLAAQGWRSVSNTTETVQSEAGLIRVAGVDDPYLKRHRTDHIRSDRDDVFAVGLTHAPDVVSEWALSGFDLVVAGHTHGGQVRFPGVGALVTNSSLPAALAMGPHRVGSTWLHVSPGVGTSKFTPIRFLARPEVTLLQIAPEVEDAGPNGRNSKGGVRQDTSF